VRQKTLVNSFSCLNLRFSEEKKIPQGSSRGRKTRPYLYRGKVCGVARAGPSRKASRGLPSSGRPTVVVGAWLKSRSQIPKHPSRISNPNEMTAFQARSSMRISEATSSNSRRSAVSGGTWGFPSMGARARRKPLRTAGNLHCCTDARRHVQAYHLLITFSRSEIGHSRRNVRSPSRRAINRSENDVCVVRRFETLVRQHGPRMGL
jgi:hypothetical protein